MVELLPLEEDQEEQKTQSKDSNVSNHVPMECKDVWGRGDR